MGEPGLKVSFEDAVEQLEEIISLMEEGNLSLDECLARFEQAVALSRYCAAKLEAAERQVSVLTGAGAPRPVTDLDWSPGVGAGVQLREG